MILALKGKQLTKDSPLFNTALAWIKATPYYDADLEVSQELRRHFCFCFNVSEAELISELVGRELVNPDIASNEARLAAILPPSGWFQWYREYTSQTEGPLSYHIFSSIALLGAALGRRVFFNMGFFRVYPNCAVVLIGPPGIKKSTVTDIARNFVDRVGLCDILSDKATPEALIGSLKKNGHQLLYAPEFSIFFGKQRYNEGLTNMMLRLLDTSENAVKVTTISRGDEILENLALSILGGTTPSLLADSTPTEVSSSGFLSRLLLIYERVDTRSFYRPQKGPHEDKIIAQLERLKALIGELQISPDADKWFKTWYDAYKLRMLKADDLTAESTTRTPVHVIRLAMIIHLVQCDNFIICDQCLQTAAKLIQFVHDSTPQVIRVFKQSLTAKDLDFILGFIRKAGGAVEHSVLLRKVSSRMNTHQLRINIQTLKEAGQLMIDKRANTTFYMLNEGFDAID